MSNNPNVLSNDLVYALNQIVISPGSLGIGIVKDEGKVRFVITGAGPANLVQIRGQINNQDTWDVLAEFTGNVNELVEVFTYDILEVLCVVFEASNGYDFKIVASSFDSNKLTIDTPNGTIDNFNTLTFESSDDTIEITADPLTGTIDFTTGAGAGVSSVNGRTGDVVLDKSDVNLDQVDNTSDADKPISTATQAELDLITDVNWTGDYNNGVTYTVGDGVMFNGASFRMIAAIGAAGYNPAAYPANWLQVTDYLSANDIGLENVDNTSDADKPISDATQEALDEKVAKAGDVMSGTLTVSVPSVGATDLGWQGISSQSADSTQNSQYTLDNALIQISDPGISTLETSIYPNYVTVSNNDVLAGTVQSIVMESGQISLELNNGIATIPTTPTLPKHVTPKKYVDDQDALKVSRSDTDNATEVWVSPTGDNSQLNVGSQFYPYASIQQAFNSIPDATSIQQWANERIVIHLKTGEYNESPVLFYKRRSITVVGHGAKLLQDLTLNYDPKNQYPGFTYTQASLPAPWTNGFASPTLSLCCENDANGMESGFTTDAMMFLGAIKFIIANYATQATPNYGTSYVTMNGIEARGGFQVLDAGSSSNGSVTLEVMTSVINGANVGLTRAGGLGSSLTLKATDSRITSDIGPRIILNKLESCRLGKLDRTYGGYTEGAIQFINTTATTGITNCTFVGTGTQYIGNTTGSANSTIKSDLATWYQLRALTLDYGTGCLFNIMDSSKLVRVVAAEAGSTTMTNVTDHLFLDPIATRTAYTITMKANPVDGDEIQLSSGSFGITNLTLLGNTGQSINGAITGLPANSWAKYRWNVVTNKWIFSGSYLSSIQTQLDNKISISEKGAANGVAPLNGSSKIDSTYLPSYVDDVIEVANYAALPVTGETGKIYITLDTNLCYRWSGSVYVEISPAPVTSVNGKTNAVTLNAIDIPFSPTLTILSDDVQAAIEEIGATATVIFEDTKEPTGFINRAESTTSFSDLDRKFTITPVSPSFSFYIKGQKFSKTVAQELTIPNLAGNHYIYFNAAGELESTQVFSSDIIESYAFVSIIYWNTDTNTHIYYAEERHGATMDGATHMYLHTTFGSRYLSGLALQNFTADGNGSLDAHAQFTADEGSIRDEDILLSSVAQTEIPILFRQGQLWRKKTADAFPVIYSGTAGYTGASGRLPYNQYIAGAWQLTEVATANYVLVHFFATNDKENPIVGIQGTAEYNNAPQAKAAASSEITSLTGLPFAEFVAIGTVIFQTNSYTNTPDARVISVNGGNYIDFRGTQLYTPAGTATTHSLLSGLSNDDHIQYHTDARGDARYYTKSQVDNLISGAASPGDIDETSFNISNSQALPDNVHNFVFANAVVRGFTALVTVAIDADSDLFEQFTLNGIQTGSSWNMTTESEGDDSGVVFSITSAGQIQYTSSNYTGFVSGTIKFRAITTSI